MILDGLSDQYILRALGGGHTQEGKFYSHVGEAGNSNYLPPSL